MMEYSDVDFAMEELGARIGENLGHISIDVITGLTGNEYRIRAYVSVLGDNRNIIGPAMGESLEEAIQDMNRIIDKEEELYTWPWWAAIHSDMEWRRIARKKWPDRNP